MFCCVAASAIAADTDRPDGYWERLERAAHHALMQEVAAAGGETVPFTTDGCSGGLSAIWRQMSGKYGADGGPPFEACCIAHDRLYHNAAGIGGADPIASEEAVLAAASQRARLAADQALRRCVERNLSGKDPTIANLASPVATAIYAAVRFGGAPCSGLSWRWGYGYRPCRGNFTR
ncbi:hypothetical protein PhaeoP128_03049 [Phaeobacter gallaeciensis]|nr:hypothetical protein PhaeoP129_03048 [Phaeobacter gallaeciensis]ATF23765.1 hypothetical protein PhaeoP128_03049 [Phaeobacter gallaeciensis]